MSQHLFLISLICLCSYFSYGQGNYYKPKCFVVLDSIQGERMIDQCSRHRPDSVTEFWAVTELEKRIFLSEFKTMRQMTNDKSGVIGRGPKAWKKYCFQIIGFIRGTKKYIYLNAFNIIGEKENYKSGVWKERPVMACGGGDWYWGATFDMETRSFVDLDINVSH